MHALLSWRMHPRTRRHLRLVQCGLGAPALWRLPAALPGLCSLVIKEPPLAGLGGSSLAAIAGLAQLTALAVTLQPGADVGVLAGLRGLRRVCWPPAGSLHACGGCLGV